MGYVAFNISEVSRAALLLRFPPRFAVIVCHHITVQPQVEVAPETLPSPASLKVVGYSTDDTGLEALIVQVDGKLERAFGGIFHVTHSLAEGRAKVESNEVIEKFGWTPLAEPITIDAIVCWNP